MNALTKRLQAVKSVEARRMAMLLTPEEQAAIQAAQKAAYGSFKPYEDEGWDSYWRRQTDWDEDAVGRTAAGPMAQCKVATSARARAWSTPTT